MKLLQHSLALLLGILLIHLLPAQAQSDFPSSSPEAEGISSSAILSFVEALEADIDAVHSYMLLRHGKLISQGWWAPYGPNSPHVMHSLSKSFTSTAIGLAIGEGKLSLNDPVISFFPEETPENPSWQLKAMRIRDLITMNTGHIQDPRVFTETGSWVKYFLAQEVDLKPGTHFKYNSAATYMLSAILQKVTGEKLVDYLDKRLFQVLNIQKPEWDTCPMGINTGGWGLHIRTEDIAKLGQLYLQKGMWKGERILSESWVAMASSKQVSNGSNPDNDWEQGYGFQFWQCRHNCYRGDGAKGQFCIVMPEHDAVLAITSGTNDMGGVMQVVWDKLLPAFEKKALPENIQAHTQLQQKTNQLVLAPILGGTSSPISKKLRKKTFHMTDSPTGIKSITFNLHKEDHSISLEMEGGTETISIGLDTYLKGKLTQTIPYTQNLVPAIAASGSWVKPDEYKLRIYFYESPARMTYTFRFEKEKMTWDSKLEHSLFGIRKQEQLHGEVK